MEIDRGNENVQRGLTVEVRQKTTIGKKGLLQVSSDCVILEK